MSMELIGVATKPQALKGQFRIKPSILNLKTFKKLKSVTIENVEYNVESVSVRDTFVIIKLQGVDTCERAETFRNKFVFADIKLEKVESFEDLTGFSVVVDSINIGTIVDINNYGSKDILSVSGERNLMFPVVDNLIISTDVEKKSITLNKNTLEEVAVYED